MSEGPSSFSSIYCTFANNSAKNFMGIRLHSNMGTITFAIIIHNNSPSFGVIFVNGGAPKMMYCIFDMNSNTLFCVQSGSIQLSHCFISHNDQLSSDLSIETLTNNSFSKIETYQLQFFSSYLCNTDSVPERTPINTEEQTPQESPMSTLDHTLHKTPLDTFEKSPQETKDEEPTNNQQGTFAITMILSICVFGCFLFGGWFLHMKSINHRESTRSDSNNEKNSTQV